MEHKPRELKLHVKEMVPANQERQAGTRFHGPSATPLLFSCWVMSDSFVTPCTTAHQAPLCPWDFPGKSIGVGCHFLLLQTPPQESSQPRNWTRVSCIGRRTLYHWAAREAPTVPWGTQSEQGDGFSQSVHFDSSLNVISPTCHSRNQAQVRAEPWVLE